MFTDTAKIQPDVDKSAAKKMEKDLNSRFGRVAKRFSTGLRKAIRHGLTFTGLTALAGGVIAKLLNPLQETEELLNRVLDKGASATDAAEDLGTDAGKLMRLEAVAQMKGVDQQTMRDMLNKFQVALAREREAAAAGQEAGTLRNFVNEKDTAQAFLDFIRSMQAVDKDRQVIVQNEIFGDRVRGRAAAFFNETKILDLLRMLPDSMVLGPAIERTNTIAGERDVMTVVNEVDAFIKQSKAIPENIVNTLDRAQQNRIEKEVEQLSQFESLRNAQQSLEESINELRKLVTEFLQYTGPDIIQSTKDFAEGARALAPILQGIGKTVGTGFNDVVKAAADLSVKHEGMLRWFLDNSAIYQYYRRNVKGN